MRVLSIFLICFACQLFVQAKPYRFQWVKTLTGPGVVNIADMATDRHSNYYLLGDFTGTMDADPGPGQTLLSASANGSFFVCKYDSTGQLIWGLSFMNTNNWGDQARAIDVDSFGNIYLAGSFQVLFDADPGPAVSYLSSPISYDQTALLIKLDSMGLFVWARQMGGPFNDRIESIATDAVGNTYITGFIQDSLDMDPGPDTLMLVSPGYESAFMGKISPAGDLLWAHLATNLTGTSGKGVRLSPQGKPYFWGDFGLTVDFDPGPGVFNLVNSNGACPYVVSYDTSGQNPAGWCFPSTPPGGFPDVKDMSLDDNGMVYLTGFFTGSVDFNPGPAQNILSSAGANEIFVCKLDTAGNLQWAKSMQGPLDEEASSITVDTMGQVFTTGFYNSITDFDPGVTALYLYPTQPTNSDGFISGLTGSGQLHSAKRIAGTGLENPQVIRLDAGGALILSGNFEGATDFCPEAPLGNMTSTGYTDGFILRMIPCETLQSVLNQTACNDYLFDGQVLTQSGQYRDTLVSEYGCDSVIVLNLTVIPVDTAVVKSGASLTAQATAATFQWLTCPGYAVISGETAAQFTAGSNGGYAVVVTQNGCSDTSACRTVSGLGLGSASDLLVSVFPNPASNWIMIQGAASAPILSYHIFDLSNRSIQQGALQAAGGAVPIESLPAGTYLLTVLTAKGPWLTRLILN